MAVVSHINRQGGFRLRTLNRHAPASSLGTGQIFVHESGPYPRGPEPSGRLSVETETPVRGMDLRRGRDAPLCISGIDPMPPLVLPLSSYLSGDRCASTPLVGHESACFPSGQTHPSRIVQGKDIQSPPSPGSPFWPSQTWFSELVSLLEGDPWEIPVRKDLLCQLQGRIWHPRP